MATFHFNEEKHEYTLNGVRIDSVTQILRKAGLLYYTNSSEENMLRGDFVHRATEMIDRGTLDWESLDPILLPYCEAYVKFCQTVNMAEIVCSEKPMYHSRHLYAGKPDRVIQLNGVRSVLDIKSGSPHPATKVQIAAYAEMVTDHEGIPFLKGYSLHLRDNGTYRLDEIGDMKRHFQTFLAALTVARWKEENL